MYDDPAGLDIFMEEEEFILQPFLVDSEPHFLNPKELNDWQELSSDQESSDEESAVSVESGSATTCIESIEDMVLSFMEQLAISNSMDQRESEDYDTSECDRKVLRTDYRIELQLVDRTKYDIGSMPAMKRLRYPRRSATGSLKPFAQLFRVLDLAHEATLSGIPATKRDIYYKDVALFKKQKVVDGFVDDLAATFGLERSDLNIRSSSKGLVCGSCLAITLQSGETIYCNDTEGTLIPAGEDIEAFSLNNNVAWVLVVEKEAVFQTLCRLKLSQHEMMPGRGLIITGKGYPDVATRHLLKSLADALPRSIPFLGLVDGDPYGLDILSVYKYGSKSMRHESEKLATRRIKWLGVWASELASLGIDKNNLLQITAHDEKKALSILRRPNFPLPGRWRKELQNMLHCRRKAEIEILSYPEDRPEGQRTSQDTGEDNMVNQDLLIDDVSSLSGSVPRSSDAILTRCGIRRPSPSLDDNSDNSYTPYAPLLRYLTIKVTKFVESACSQNC